MPPATDIAMSQRMSQFVPNTAILLRIQGSPSELTHRKIKGPQPKHHFRNPMLYPFELRALDCREQDVTLG
jgi:hypothetical protein